MDSIRCSNCSLLNFATAEVCKRCNLPLASASGNEWGAHDYAHSETYAQPTEAEATLWDRPSYRPNYVLPPVASSSVAPKIIKIFIALAVVFLVSFLAIPALLKPKKVDLNNLSWSEYQSPDGKFSISLPVAPKPLTLSQATPFGNVQVNTLSADVSKDGGCMLMYADYPVEHINMSEETLYNMALQGAASRQNVLGIGARRYITLGSFRGIEVELKPTDPKMLMNATCRIFWVSPRLYVVLAGGPDTAEYKAVQTRCLDSFKLLKR